MNLFSPDQLTPPTEQRFAFLEVTAADHVLTITLDRAAKKNALHPQMVNELAYAMQYAHATREIWVVVLAAKGTVFCAGADLKAFAGMAAPHDSSIPSPQGEVLIGELFARIHKPTIALVEGDVYAGGFLLLAGCTIVLAQEGVKLSLPEVKRGLFPFQVMAALLRVMPERKVLDWCLRGYELPLAEALSYGLITEVCAKETIAARLDAIIQELQAGSPSALRLGLQAYEQLRPATEEHRYLMQMLQKTLMTKDGQEGLRAFREKRDPRWTGE
jgi:enoyl-CoA hydratase/carnithine racemase